MCPVIVHKCVKIDFYNNNNNTSKTKEKGGINKCTLISKIKIINLYTFNPSRTSFKTCDKTLYRNK